MKIKREVQGGLGGLRLIAYIMIAILILVLLAYFQIMQPQNSISEQDTPVDSFGTLKPKLPTPASIAFPGAEGFGISTPGGRYGRIMFVTNLNDTTDANQPEYLGSLRWAVESTWPVDMSNPYSQRRMIIFKIGGVISLVDSLILKNPFVTIAGQTAPGDGIMLKGSELVIATHDVILRGVRIRVGDQGEPTCCLDGINISTHHANSDVYNIIVDHSSVSWAVDENMSTYVDPARPYTAHDITIQWSIISEGLHNSIHLDEGATKIDPHSMGAILGKDGRNMTIHHNIFSHNWARNPRIAGIINSEVINNVIYGWGNAAVEISQDKNITHILNNYFKANSDSREYEISLSKNMNPESQIYFEGNLTYDLRESSSLISARIKMPEGFQSANGYLFTPSNVSVDSAEEAYITVLNFAGANYPVRDLVDLRIVHDVKNGTGEIIDSQNQVGAWPFYQDGVYPTDSDKDGIPSDWEIEHGLDPTFAGDANNPNFLSPDGYTWIEAYVNSLIPSP